MAKIHRTVRCVPDCPVSQQRPRQRSAAWSAGNAWPEPTVTKLHQTVWCAQGTKGSTIGFSRKGKKSTTIHVRWCTGLSGGAPDCPVRQRTEGKNCLPNGDLTAPSSLGAIKRAPMRMEQYTNPPLNILRRLGSASTHPNLYVWDLSTSWIVNSLRCVLCSCLDLCACCCCDSSFCVCFFPSLALVVFHWD
jgi:hypothetical protein